MGKIIFRKTKNRTLGSKKKQTGDTFGRNKRTFPRYGKTLPGYGQKEYHLAFLGTHWPLWVPFRRPIQWYDEKTCHCKSRTFCHEKRWLKTLGNQKLWGGSQTKLSATVSSIWTKENTTTKRTWRLHSYLNADEAPGVRIFNTRLLYFKKSGASLLRELN